MPDLPLFQPRIPLSKSKAKSICCRIKFLNILRNRTPQSATNTACTRLRLHCKHIAEKKRQLELIEHLQQRLEALSAAEPSTLQAAHCSEPLKLIMDHLQVLTHQCPSTTSASMLLLPATVLSQLLQSFLSISHPTAHTQTFTHFHAS
jgi:hypothetical protein